MQQIVSWEWRAREKGESGFCGGGFAAPTNPTPHPFPMRGELLRKPVRTRRSSPGFSFPPIWGIITPANLLPAACYLLPAACYLLPATCYLLPATCYLLPAACYLLPAAC